MSDVLVVGTGLIGTSLALALTGQRDVCLVDRDPDNLAVAVAAGAGRPWDGAEEATVVVVAVPPRATARELTLAISRDLARTYTHVASVQTHVQRELEALGQLRPSVCAGHPMAGREMGGPAAADPELFLGRRWAVCPHPLSSDDAVRDVTELAVACGADVLRLSAEDHDVAVALVSHLPHATSAVLAGLLAGMGSLELSGPGLIDTTRLAAGDPALWAQILELNAEHVAPLVQHLGQVLTGMGDLLDQVATGGHDYELARRELLRVLEQGRAGRARVPVKRGMEDGGFATVTVVLRDQPGQLAALLVAAAEHEVNVEDVRVEHAPGRPTGKAVLLVRKDDQARAQRVLSGWTGNR